VELLTERPSSLNFKPSKSDSNNRRPELSVLRGGSQVAQASLIELKSRGRKASNDFPGSGEYLQQYIGQIPTMLVGFHDNGTFTIIKERKLDSEEVRAHAKKVAPGLAKLRAVLMDIQTTVAELGPQARLSLLYKDGQLCLVQRSDSGSSLLPEEALMRFND
jgi:hypothetical protein